MWSGPVLRQSLIFCLGSAVNGALCSIVGPSLKQFHESTGLSEAGLANVVLVNKSCKFLGSIALRQWAEALQARRALVSPGILLALCACVISLCSLLLATVRSSPAVLYLCLAAPGAAYGIADAAFVQLTVWANKHPEGKRVHVALLNVGFTIGALIAPAVLATALRTGRTTYVGFYFLSGTAACVAPLLLSTVEPDLRTHAATAAHTVAVASSPLPGKAEALSLSQSRAIIMVGLMAVVLFATTGTEHATATWLPTYGHEAGGLEMEEMASMSSAFWGMIALSRILWVFVAGIVTSGFPALLFDGLLMLLGSLLITDWQWQFVSRLWSKVPKPTQGTATAVAGRLLSSAVESHAARSSSSAQLWAGATCLGFGCSTYVVAITLPSEARVELTPTRLLVLNLAGSAGEMLPPFLVGLCFERKLFGALGLLSSVLTAAICVATLAAWRVTHRLKQRQPILRRGNEEKGDEEDIVELTPLRAHDEYHGR